MKTKYNLDGNGNLDKGSLALLKEVQKTMDIIHGIISTTEAVYTALDDKDVLYIFNLIDIIQGQLDNLRECLTDPSRL